MEAANKPFEEQSLADFEQIGFKGIPMIEDYNANFLASLGAGALLPRAYLLNEEDFYDFQHKDAKWDREETRVPPDSDTVIIPFQSMMNQVCTNRRHSFVYYAT